MDKDELMKKCQITAKILHDDFPPEFIYKCFQYASDKIIEDFFDIKNPYFISFALLIVYESLYEHTKKWEAEE